MPTLRPVPIEQILSREISLFSSVKAPRPKRSISLDEYLNGVKSGVWRDQIERIRATNSVDKTQASRLKEQLPAIKPAGIFKGSAQNTIIATSGILCLDLDELGTALSGIRLLVHEHPSVIAEHVSPRGNGLKVFMLGTATCAKEHSPCWQEAAHGLARHLPQGIKIDRAPSNVASNCFVSYDPEIWVATDPRQQIPHSNPRPSQTQRGEGEGGVISGKSMSDFGTGASMSVFSGKPTSVQGTIGNLGNSAREHHRKVRRQAEQELEERPAKLARIFKKYLGQRTVNRGARYHFLTKVIPPLHTVVGEDVLLELLHLHHRLNSGTWSTGLSDHMIEATRMLNDWEREDYQQRSLTPNERAVYLGLDCVRVRSTYRILRDLAQRSETTPRFFISIPELATRLGCARDTADRTLREMRADGLIAEVAKGQVWRKGVKPLATIFRWLEPLCGIRKPFSASIEGGDADEFKPAANKCEQS